jgi:preprotein translocase SecE subunit
MSSVAVKNQETSSPSVLDRLHVGILAGLVYVLGSLAILFGLLPWVWWHVFRLDPGSAVNNTLLVLVGLAAAGGLGFVGARLLGPQPVPGVKAGTFVALVSLLLIVLLTRWASIYVENWVYGPSSPGETIGIAITAAVGIVLLVLAVRFVFMAPSFGAKMVGFEEQGWFTANSYKRLQGQRVRRGTILGILILIGCGIWSLNQHQTLAGTKDWAVNIPFTGKETVTALNDAAVVFPDRATPFETDLGTFRRENARLKDNFLRLEEDIHYEKGDTQVAHSKGDVITKDEWDKARVALKREPTAKTPDLAVGVANYTTLTLLPDIRYTVPILLAALAIWGAWRVVNVPSFADFLIATEAELNKVSWTSRRRLIQDTIVVLITVVFFTVFLFLVDVAWGWVLSARPVGVIKVPEGGGAVTKQQDW